MKYDPLKLSRKYGKIFMRCIGFSWCVRYICLASDRAGKHRSGNVLFAFWHSRLLPLVYTHRDEGIVVLVSKNKDGQIITNILHSMGFASIRGSSSRGGMESLGLMAGELKAGNDAAITPDGPRGPALKPKGGAGMISRLSDTQVVPMATSGTPSIRFKSWDRFMLPLPFARVCIVEGNPIPPLQKGEEDRWNKEFERSLNRVTAIADMESSIPVFLFSPFLSCFRNLISLSVSLLLSLRRTVKHNERLGRIHAKTDSPVLIYVSSDTSANDIQSILNTCLKKSIPTYVVSRSPAMQSSLQAEGIESHLLPFDAPHYVDRFLSALKPRALIVTGTCVASVLIRKLIRMGSPAFLCANLSSGQSPVANPLFKSHYARLLACFSDIYVSTETGRDIYIELGIPESVISVVSVGDAPFTGIDGFPVTMKSSECEE